MRSLFFLALFALLSCPLCGMCESAYRATNSNGMSIGIARDGVAGAQSQGMSNLSITIAPDVKRFFANSEAEARKAARPSDEVLMVRELRSVCSKCSESHQLVAVYIPSIN